MKLTPPASHDAAPTIADALGRLRYRPAGEEVLARLSNEPDRFFQEWYARVLAELRYEPAAAAIEALCETTPVDGDWLDEQRRLGRWSERLPEISRLRIVGPWGAAAGGLRVLLLSPAHPASGGRIRITALIENVGDSDLDRLRMIAGLWIIDGTEQPGIDSVLGDGNMAVSVNGLDERTVDVTERLSATLQTHTIAYRLLGASSNVLSVTVR